MGDTGWLVPTLRVFAVAMVNVSLKVSTGWAVKLLECWQSPSS
jgi:hypothetical protein